MIVEEFVAWIGKADDAERADGASALARLWLDAALPPDQQEAAEAALTALLDDPSSEVRAALAAELGDAANAPKHIVLALAVDEPAISLPVLARSPVLLDAELADLAAGGSREHQVAIACRAAVPLKVSAAIAEHGCRDACLALMSNDGARMTSVSLHTMATRHGGDTELRRMLLKRGDLRPATRLLLIERLGDHLRAQAEALEMPAARVEALIAANRDKAIVSWASRADESELPGIVAAMVDARRLTAAFLLRSVCMGNLALFSASLAHLSQVAPKRVEAVLSENRQAAFRAIYLKSDLPEAAFEVFACAVALWRRGLAQPAAAQGTDLVYRVTRELLAAFGSRKGEAFDPLLVLLRRLAAEAAREHARGRVTRIAVEAQERERLMLEASAEAERAAAEAEQARLIAEQFPVVDLPVTVLSAFAMHLADEIVEMETQTVAESPADETEAFAGLLEAANDRLMAASQAAPDITVIDMGEATRLREAA